jgi:redox-sensitive bicupin YhaK (pirin superfamily)
MMKIRKAGERGHFDHGWLDTYHTFSFADYHDPEQMGWSRLRVLNDDTVAPGAGFPPHSHRDMEIVTLVLEGALEHRDSLGNGSIIRPGDVQRMSAGTGVTHSEYNPSDSEPVHLLQIWILPAQRHLQPSYEQKTFPESERRGRLRLVASPDAREGSVRIHQDATLHAGMLRAGETARHPLAPDRKAYVHVARGEASVQGTTLHAGDGARIADEKEVRLEGLRDADVLLFDLPS